MATDRFLCLLCHCWGNQCPLSNVYHAENVVRFGVIFKEWSHTFTKSQNTFSITWVEVVITEHCGMPKFVSHVLMGIMRNMFCTLEIY